MQQSICQDCQSQIPRVTVIQHDNEMQTISSNMSDEHDIPSSFMVQGQQPNVISWDYIQFKLSKSYITTREPGSHRISSTGKPRVKASNKSNGENGSPYPLHSVAQFENYYTKYKRQV